jgi:hypothetical protein
MRNPVCLLDEIAPLPTIILHLELLFSFPSRDWKESIGNQLLAMLLAKG